MGFLRFPCSQEPSQFFYSSPQGELLLAASIASPSFCIRSLLNPAGVYFSNGPRSCNKVIQLYNLDVDVNPALHEPQSQVSPLSKCSPPVVDIDEPTRALRARSFRILSRNRRSECQTLRLIHNSSWGTFVRVSLSLLVWKVWLAVCLSATLRFLESPSHCGP
ncbi:hypothetical protein BDQ17DRAFT_872888 [Cyathus striatus]|nr:hypothetical protein BDQ17DRAFT_872888 [Cyathus striatus]